MATDARIDKACACSVAAYAKWYTPKLMQPVLNKSLLEEAVFYSRNGCTRPDHGLFIAVAETPFLVSTKWR